MFLSLVTLVVREYDPAIAFFVDVLGFELVVGSKGSARTFVLRDAQHEYEFLEQK